MGVHRYYDAQVHGRTGVEAPPEIIEIGLMERFHWTPMEIDQIPLGRMQRIFVAMEQMEQSKSDLQEIEIKKAGDLKKTNANQNAKPKKRK